MLEDLKGSRLTQFDLVLVPLDDLYRFVSVTDGPGVLHQMSKVSQMDRQLKLGFMGASEFQGSMRVLEDGKVAWKTCETSMSQTLTRTLPLTENTDDGIHNFGDENVIQH